MRKSWHFAGYIVVLLLTASCSREVSPTTEQTGARADLILTNGKIITVDSNFTIAEAVAIGGGRILAVGTNAEISALANADTVISDLEGRSVVPGLIDNHNHFVRATEQWYRQVRWDDVTTRERALQMLQERAASLPDGEWVVVLGGWIFEQFTDNQKDFTRAELDALLPNTPVYIQQGYTRGFVNSNALTRAGLTPAAALAPGVEINDGELTGVLNGSPAFLSVADKIPATPDATWNNSLQLTMQDYLAQGMTTLLDIGGNTVTPRHYEILERAAANNALRMRVFYTLNATNGVGASADAIIDALNTNPPTTGNDQFGQFTYGEMTFEGIRDPNGAVWNPAPEAFTDYGRILSTAAERGWQIHEHSTRDDKMQAALDLMATVNATTPIAPLRWTIAHAEQASDATIAKAKELGVVFALHSSGGLGAVASAANGEDVSRVPPIREINDAGVLWGLGSDGTVVSGFHPFQNIGWAVTGIARNGEKLLQSTVSREDALRAHTISNAMLLFKEDSLGSLEPGKYADLVILDRDYMNISETEIKDIKPILTMVNGEVVYTAP
jgi:predicted amidohydrolase YtcJ